MRHPLFVDPTTTAAGLPRNILSADGEVTIFDTALDPQAVWAITLYVWWHTNSAVPVNPPGLLGRVYNNGEAVATRAPVLLPDTFFTDLSAAQAPLFAPYKIIDKLCLRGSQILKLQNTEAASENCFVWGYAERVGESVLGKPYRPLQPQGNNLVTPFVGDPQALLVADGEQDSLVIHKLTSTYIDYLTLNLSTACNDTSVAKLVMPDGAEILMPFVTAAAQLPLYPLFDGIPMRAGVNMPTELTLDLAPDGGKQGYMGAYGHFIRD